MRKTHLKIKKRKSSFSPKNTTNSLNKTFVRELQVFSEHYTKNVHLLAFFSYKHEKKRQKTTKKGGKRCQNLEDLDAFKAIFRKKFQYQPIILVTYSFLERFEVIGNTKIKKSP